MYRRGVSRGLWPLLLGLGLLAGLFLMHGVTATPTPIHISAPVIASHVPGPHTAGTPAPHEGASEGSSEQSSEQSSGHSGHSGAHDAGCGAGVMCFALLVGLALALARGRAFNALMAWAFRAVPATRSPSRKPRPRPPSIYRLSVLRL
ncbi:DUF6153 family protein [Actinomadura rugatobispora]|uniref:DUF6153 family protein n=1 Tax=Actinomadura rugatobispora TaxID=1994 RepID=A0ABW0ZSZ7_9ACTN|nr:hypothetical protein GCM10010200_060280 [Actinomadura rugatobispora]